jgi:hypothetical protein
MITLQFSTQHDLGSAIIRWGNWSDVSHVDLVLPDGLLLGARTDHNPGVQVRPKGYAKFSRIIQVDYDFTDAQTEIYHAWCRSQLGKPYDKPGIASYITHKRKNLDWRDESSWYCSELQARASEIASNPFLDFGYQGAFKCDPAHLLMSKLTIARRYIL